MRKKNEENKILEVFKKSADFMTPLEAANQAGVNKNTARAVCQKLLKEGKLIKQERGYYKSKRS